MLPEVPVGEFIGGADCMVTDVGVEGSAVDGLGVPFEFSHRFLKLY